MFELKKVLYACGAGIIIGLVIVEGCQIKPRQSEFKPTVTRHTAEVARVIDGDTIVINAPYLPKGLPPYLHLRVFGVDTPEQGKRAKCEDEKYNAIEAKIFVTNAIYQAKDIKVIYKRWDKYGGRVLGDLELDSKLLSEMLLENGYAKVYKGRLKVNWC